MPENAKRNKNIVGCLVERKGEGKNSPRESAVAERQESERQIDCMSFFFWLM